MSELITLDAFNANRRTLLQSLNTYPRPNGIACPKCGKEMQDMDAMVLCSNPPKKRINCPACGHHGNRVA